MNIEINILKFSDKNKQLHEIHINNENMINATIFCRGTKKEFCKYKILKKTEKEIQNIINKHNIPKEKLIISNSNSAWIHVYLLKNYSLWISKDIGKQISDQIDSLNILENIKSNAKEDIIRNFTLTNDNDISSEISIREDNYINVSQICKLYNRIIGFWKRNASSMELIKNTENAFTEYVDGTYAHPNISMKIAKWCSDKCEKQISEILNDKILKV